MKKRASALLIMLAVVVGVSLRHETPAGALTAGGGGGDVCNHFSVDYDSWACFLAGGGGGGTNGGGGGGGTLPDSCPGGSPPACVACDGVTCTAACTGGYTCRIFKDGGEIQACSTPTHCKTY